MPEEGEPELNTSTSPRPRAVLTSRHTRLLKKKSLVSWNMPIRSKRLWAKVYWLLPVDLSLERLGDP
ncbi:hypothetical protein E2C01_083346 [Portunus trituberculatus]|uniref:Uncharacterized protein n=1 Tax=Portunus trituberculatus TaxID=210409 RepID=A0A5B7J1R7_PORTR|nr:hypothetical protein [Portunus trituberculatus]